MQFTGVETEAAPDGEPFEDDRALGLPTVVLGLDTGHQLQGDVLDREVAVTALELDLSAELPAGHDRARVEDRVHGGPTHTERAEQPLEHHRGVHSFMCTYGSSPDDTGNHPGRPLASSTSV